jgi:hypothetical protein
MKHNKLFESILRRLLKESQEEHEERGRRRLAQAAGMAALVKGTSESANIVLYDPNALLDFAASNPKLTTLNQTEAIPIFLDKIIIGVIGANRTFHPCNGAWEINKSAVRNKGDGGLIYGLAYAVAGGNLTPDRYSVTLAAQRGWLQQDSRNGEPFDDASLPPEERRTPDDPSDDCDLHRNGDKCGTHLDLSTLNRSYESEGWEQTLLYQLRDAHDATLRQLNHNAPKFEELLLKNGKRFFNKYHHP